MKNLFRLWTVVGGRLEDASKSVILLCLGAYRSLGTAHFGGSCRFEPSCSAYAVDAASLHRPLKALRLISLRVAKCRPGGPFGYDPVPAPETGDLR